MGGKPDKDRKDKIIEDDFVDVEKFSGRHDEFGERKGEGAYFFPNGDIYDGDWKKGKKHGYGMYTYSDGKSIKGWFYKDQFIGSEPNEKLKKKLKKKNKKCEKDAATLPPPASIAFFQPDERDSKPFPTILKSNSLEDVSTAGQHEPDGFRRTKSERRAKSAFKRNYRLPSKEDEKMERKRSVRLRQSIRAKYGLPVPSRKNPLLSGSD